MLYIPPCSSWNHFNCRKFVVLSRQTMFIFVCFSIFCAYLLYNILISWYKLKKQLSLFLHSISSVIPCADINSPIAAIVSLACHLGRWSLEASCYSLTGLSLRKMKSGCCIVCNYWSPLTRSHVAWLRVHACMHTFTVRGNLYMYIMHACRFIMGQIIIYMHIDSHNSYSSYERIIRIYTLKQNKVMTYNYSGNYNYLALILQIR